MDYFADSYLNGQTPNPCVLCNEKIKFPVFLPLLEQLEADFIATGHYVRLFKQFCDSGKRPDLCSL